MDWREKFERFVEQLGEAEVYVTVDLDCLRAEEAVTNWESGRFTVEDVAWAIARLAEKNRIVGGDICGAWSRPVFARGNSVSPRRWITPSCRCADPTIVRQTNLAALRRLLPVLAQVDL